MIIGLVGDLEGDLHWAVRVLRSLGRNVDVAVQLGDLRFGMGPDPVRLLDLATLGDPASAVPLRRRSRS